jgi:hypothetical protein
MKTDKYVRTAVILTLAGVLFSGYLSGVKFFSGACAFKEGCPVFLGYPACYYGFAMFSTMFVATLLALVRRASGRWPLQLNLAVSALGLCFSGSFAVREIAVWFQPGQFRLYGLGLSTCVYGFLFYIVIFVFTALALKREPAGPVTPAAAPPKA